MRRSTPTPGLRFNLKTPMEKRPPLPKQRDFQQAYRLAHKLACEELVRIDDIAEQCRRSGAKYQSAGSKKTITLKYLNQQYRVSLPDVTVSLSGGRQPVPLRDRLLILHYLIRAKGSPPSGKVITFKELPEGNTYFPTFYKRAIRPVLNNFGGQPQRLLEAATKLGGRKAGYGDVAAAIDAFPRVAITFVLWQGDSELPAEGSIFFDSTIADYLGTEDITVLCQTIAFKLVAFLGQAG